MSPASTLVSTSSGVAGANTRCETHVIKATLTAKVFIVLNGVTRFLASIRHTLRSVEFQTTVTPLPTWWDRFDSWKRGATSRSQCKAIAFANFYLFGTAFHTGNRTGAVTRVIDKGNRDTMTSFRAMLLKSSTCSHRTHIFVISFGSKKNDFTMTGLKPLYLDLRSNYRFILKTGESCF